MPYKKSPLQLTPERSALWVIDVQEKLVSAISSGKHVVRQTLRLLDAAELLEIPAAATVQYPEGLGELVQPLADRLPEPEEKLSFSATSCRAALDQWADEGRDQILVVGLETHICIQQTVLDLLAEGFFPYVVGEAVASRHGRDQDYALERMLMAGAVTTTVESVMFEWLGTAEHEHFKAISDLVKRNPRRRDRD